MRPRSRLLSKTSLLLPTIREGSEEMLRDMNQANTLHTAVHSVSSEDYFLSICHLAHPTFPSQDTPHDSSKVRQPEPLHQPDPLHREETRAMGVRQGEQKELGCHGPSDPLEFLYGHQDNPALTACRAGGAFAEGRQLRRYGDAWRGQCRSRAHSVPCASGPDLPCHRKGSCPELLATAHTGNPDLSAKPQAGGERPTDRDSEGERQDPSVKHTLISQEPSVKHTLISQWITDCRSAWRETRVRTSMLPAIAEI